MVQHSSVERRSAVIAGFLVQEKILSLVGKSLYPLFNYVLETGFGIRDELLRFRWVMGVCTLFCLFGVVYLHRRRQDMPRSPPTDALELIVTKVQPASDETTRRAILGAAAQRGFRIVPFSLLMIALFAQAAAFTTVSLLWPLFVKDMFDWTPTEFAGALFAASLVSALCVGAFPYLDKRFRGLRVAVILTLISSISALFAFTFSRRSDLDKLLHVLLTVVFLAATATLEPCLKSLGSLFSPASAQGRSFGIMATVSGAGQMVGNSAGAYLYHLSTTATVEYPGLALTTSTWLAFVPTCFYQRGTLPLLCTSILMLVATVAVSVVGTGYTLKSVTSPPSPTRRSGAANPIDAGDQLEPLLFQRNVVVKHLSVS
jgi:hypothetical protein